DNCPLRMRSYDNAPDAIGRVKSAWVVCVVQARNGCSAHRVPNGYVTGRVVGEGNSKISLLAAIPSLVWFRGIRRGTDARDVITPRGTKEIHWLCFWNRPVVERVGCAAVCANFAKSPWLKCYNWVAKQLPIGSVLVGDAVQEQVNVGGLIRVDLDFQPNVI